MLITYKRIGGNKCPVIVPDNSKNKKIAYYYVTKQGKIFRYFKNGKVEEQKLRKNNNGYLRAQIFYKDYYIHRLVAFCYISNPNNYSEINHIDGDKTNNSVSNLEWCTRSENNQHAFKTGLRDPEFMRKIAKSEKHRVAMQKISATEVKNIRSLILNGLSDRKISEITGVSRGSIWQIRKGKTYVH